MKSRDFILTLWVQGASRVIRRFNCEEKRLASSGGGLRPITLFLVGGALVLACHSGQYAADLRPQEPPGARRGEVQKGGGSRDGEAERKLLAELQRAIDAHADHFEFSRLDRELAAAFRDYGLDLDVVDAKTAGAWRATRRRRRSPP